MTPLFDVATRLYTYMQDKSEPNGQGEQVYTGSLTIAFNASGGSSRYYSLVRTLLLSPDLDPCIELRQRGNAYQSSIVILRHPPTPELKNISPGDLTAPQIGSRMEAVERRLAAFESWRESNFREVNVVKVLLDLEKRLSSLEGERENAKNKK